MEAHAITQADYLDILFDNRNKAYGGYILRKYEGRRMVQSLFIMLALTLAFSIWAFVPAKNTAPVVTIRKTDTAVYKPVKIDIPKPPDPPAPPAVSPPAEQFTPPVIVHNEDPLADPPADIDSFAGKEPGPASIEGTPGNNTVPGNATNGNGTAPAIVEVPAKPFIHVEIMPDFNGDIYAYLTKTVRYPRQAIQSGVEGRVVVQFVVNEDGHVSDAKVLRGIGGGCDEEALRVINAMPAWKPGMQNGRAVKVFYTLPIKFALQ